MKNLTENINIKNVYFRDRVYNNEQIKSGIDNLSIYLKKNYISDSPFVILSAYNHLKTLIAFYAIIKSGKIAVIINPGLKSIELTEIINETDPAAMVLINDETNYFEYEEEIIIRSLSKSFIVNSNLDDVVILMYTNAEDGKAKAAMITETNLISAMQTCIVLENISEQKRLCAFLPYYHLFGLTYGLIMPCYTGCSVLISDLNILHINEMALSIKNTSVTNIFSVPSFYYLLSRVCGIDKLLEPTFEFISGGIKLSPFIYDTFFKKTRKKLREGYGLTESSPGVTLTMNDTELNLDSVGQVVPNCDLKIIDQNGNECEMNVEGEICIKGENVFKGYFNNQESTNNVLKNKWLYTGDIGTKNNNGYVQFKRLKKEMYNVAGNNVYPKELERLLKMNRNVHAIKIFNEYSELHGDVIVSEIELNSSSEKNIKQFKSWCFENITNYKLPKVMNFVI